MLIAIKNLAVRWKLFFLVSVTFFSVVLTTQMIHYFSSVYLNESVSEGLDLGNTLYPHYADGTIWEQLSYRIEAQPFNMVGTLIFFCAILHTFFANKIARLAKFRESSPKFQSVQDRFLTELLTFFGEVEVVFGVWIIPLYVSMTWWYNEGLAVNYLQGRDYSEALFILVIMTLASTRPLFLFVQECFHHISTLFGGSVRAWWLTILTLGPILGSFITEPGAMTLSALLLGKHIYRSKPSKALCYATLGLLFVNISVGGVLTHFAAPPVLMVAQKWNWNTSFMFSHLGFKAVIGICLANALYVTYFWKELGLLRNSADENKVEKEKEVPLWITSVHIFLLIFAVFHSHYPVIFLGIFFLFIGFHQATRSFQNSLRLREPLLVAFFLASLIVHTSLQGWWIEPVLLRMDALSLMGMSTILTAFNDNAAITSLGSQIPDMSETMKYMLVVGAVTGGGLTVIANAPNPAGQALLQKYFPDGISPIRLLCAALIPTAIMALSFILL